MGRYSSGEVVRTRQQTCFRSGHIAHCSAVLGIPLVGQGVGGGVGAGAGLLGHIQIDFGDTCLSDFFQMSCLEFGAGDRNMTFPAVVLVVNGNAGDGVVVDSGITVIDIPEVVTKDGVVVILAHYTIIGVSIKRHSQNGVLINLILGKAAGRCVVMSISIGTVDIDGIDADIVGGSISAQIVHNCLLDGVQTHDVVFNVNYGDMSIVTGNRVCDRDIGCFLIDNPVTCCPVQNNRLHGLTRIQFMWLVNILAVFCHIRLGRYRHIDRIGAVFSVNRSDRITAQQSIGLDHMVEAGLSGGAVDGHRTVGPIAEQVIQLLVGGGQGRAFLGEGLLGVRPVVALKSRILARLDRRAVSQRAVHRINIVDIKGLGDINDSGASFASRAGNGSFPAVTSYKRRAIIRDLIARAHIAGDGQLVQQGHFGVHRDGNDVLVIGEGVVLRIQAGRHVLRIVHQLLGEAGDAVLVARSRLRAVLFPLGVEGDILLLVLCIAIVVTGLIFGAAPVRFCVPAFKFLPSRRGKRILFYKHIVCIERLRVHRPSAPIGVIFHSVEAVFGVITAHIQHDFPLNIPWRVVIERHVLRDGIDTCGNRGIIRNIRFAGFRNGIHFIPACEAVTGLPIIESVLALDLGRHVDIRVLRDIHGVGLIPGGPLVSVRFTIVRVLHIQRVAGSPRVCVGQIPINPPGEIHVDAVVKGKEI